jgi:hypothetical protein
VKSAKNELKMNSVQGRCARLLCVSLSIYAMPERRPFWH